MQWLFGRRGTEDVDADDAACAIPADNNWRSSGEISKLGPAEDYPKERPCGQNSCNDLPAPCDRLGCWRRPAGWIGRREAPPPMPKQPSLDIGMLLVAFAALAIIVGLIAYFAGYGARH